MPPTALPSDIDFLSLLTATISEWASEAACADVPTNLYYADPGSSKDQPLAELLAGRARRVCARCPVRRECLSEALRNEDGRDNMLTGKWNRRLPFGIWGGLTPAERHDKRIRHLPDCDLNHCSGCRPLEETLDALEAVFRREVPRWLTPSETIS
jgi:WhiB family redox-sensing transcriptional regulator